MKIVILLYSTFWPLSLSSSFRVRVEAQGTTVITLMVFLVLTPSSLVPNSSIVRVELCKMRNQLGYKDKFQLQIHVTCCSTFFRNVGIHIEDYAVSQHGRPQLNIITALNSSDKSQTDLLNRELHFDTASRSNFESCSELHPFVTPHSDKWGT
jgi:hypothetical protein